MFHFTIEASSVEELSTKINGLAAIFASKTKTSVQAVSNIMLPAETELAHQTEEPSTENVSQISDLSGKKKPGRKPGVKASVTEAPVVATHVAPDSEVKDPGPTKIEATAALQELLFKKGITVAREVLIKFGCARISDLKADQYSEFIAECSARSSAG